MGAWQGSGTSSGWSRVDLGRAAKDKEEAGAEAKTALWGFQPQAVGSRWSATGWFGF